MTPMIAERFRFFPKNRGCGNGLVLSKCNHIKILHPDGSVRAVETWKRGGNGPFDSPSGLGCSREPAGADEHKPADLIDGEVNRDELPNGQVFGHRTP